jgi:hypothetical protein
VIGIISLASALAPMEGHISSHAAAVPPVGGSVPPPAPPTESYPRQGQ